MMSQITFDFVVFCADITDGCFNSSILLMTPGTNIAVDASGVRWYPPPYPFRRKNFAVCTPSRYAPVGNDACWGYIEGEDRSRRL